MLKLALSSALVFVLAGCGGSSSNNPGKADPISSKSQGTFTADKGITSSFDPSIFKNTCTGNEKIDPRLSVGMSSQWALEMFSQEEGSQWMNAKFNVTSINSDRRGFNLRMDAKHSIRPDFLLSKDLSCKMTKEGIQCEFFNNSGSSSGCSLQSEGDPFKLKTSPGKFQLKSGRIVNATFISYVSKGTLYCDGRAVGQGTENSVGVVTSEIPPGIIGLYCRPESLTYLYIQVRDASGLVRKTIKAEVLSQD